MKPLPEDMGKHFGVGYIETWIAFTDGHSKPIDDHIVETLKSVD